MSDDAAEKRRAYLREHKRKQREKARLEHRCLVCISKTPTGENAVCDDCIARSVEWERERGWRSRKS